MGYDGAGGSSDCNDYGDDYGTDAGIGGGTMDDCPPEEPLGASPSRPVVKTEPATEPVSAAKAEESTAAPGDGSADAREAPTPTANRTVLQLVGCWSCAQNTPRVGSAVYLGAPTSRVRQRRDSPGRLTCALHSGVSSAMSCTSPVEHVHCRWD